MSVTVLHTSATVAIAVFLFVTAVAGRLITTRTA